MNAIRRVDTMPCMMDLRGVSKYEPIGFGLLIYSLSQTKIVRLIAEAFAESYTIVCYIFLDTSSLKESIQSIIEGIDTEL